LKIWVVEIGEPLPLEDNVRLHRYGEFTKYLAQNGHDVTWWTSTFSHAPKKNILHSDSFKIVDGVKINFIHGNGYKRNVSLNRFKHQSDFSRKLKKRINEIIDFPDIIITPIPTIDAAYVISKYCKKHKIKHFIDIRDYWPDDLVNVFPTLFRPIAKLLFSKYYKMMKVICGNTDSIMGNSNTSINYGLKFANRVRSKNDYLFYLGYKKNPNMDKFVLNESKKWFKGLGLSPNSFKICFFGQIGRFFDLNTVINSIRHLAVDEDIEFLIGGDGSSKVAFESYAKDCKSVHFLGWLDSPKIQIIMRNSNLGIIPCVLTHDFAFPNKTFEYMSGSLPIVSSVQLELPAFLDQYECGLTYDGTESSLTSSILYYLRNPEITKKMGRNAREAFEEQFSHNVLFKNVVDHFKLLLSV
jgi:glycosyltransferase involved in cell wall biosynthesis